VYVPQRRANKGTEFEALKRCNWANKSSILKLYHDEEWGEPKKNDRELFELLVLETFQAGLSWETVLKKREAFRDCFHDFDPVKVASKSDKDLATLLENPDLIRNKRKIEGAVTNARVFLKVTDQWGSFSRFLWSLTDGKTISPGWERDEDVPPYNPFSEKVSNYLKELGFVLVGPTVTHSFLQAAGLINDHIRSCFRFQEINSRYVVTSAFPDL